jgi:hypothetical protein
VKFVLYSKPSKVKTSFWQTNHIVTVLSLVEAAKLRGKTADKTANFKLVLCTGDWSMVAGEDVLKTTSFGLLRE